MLVIGNRYRTYPFVHIDTLGLQQQVDNLNVALHRGFKQNVL